MSESVNLLNFHRKGLAAYFTALGERSFRADQVVQWLHQIGVDEFGSMSNLSKALRERLAHEASVVEPQVLATQASRDGTRKWLLRLADGNCIETVFIPEADRGTLCVSSQVGCPLDCSFCATGKQGFSRNLSVAEIIGQLRVAARALGQLPRGRDRAISNVVMMGMGEPLLNFDNVVAAMDLMIDDLAYGLARRRVTLSTAGLVPAMDRLREVSPVSLAVSLHAPNNALRDELVPLNRSYPLDQLLPACKRFSEAQGHNPITFEYVMLEGVNDQAEHARQLIRCLQGIPSKINLIPFNPFPQARYRRSPPEAIDRFRERLLAAGFVTITRKTRGDDIDAACGQLVGRVQAKAARHRRRPLPMETH